MPKRALEPTVIVNVHGDNNAPITVNVTGVCAAARLASCLGLTETESAPSSRRGIPARPELL
jgi:hypothetical protein